jgi:hypothetical protein
MIAEIRYSVKVLTSKLNTHTNHTGKYTWKYRRKYKDTRMTQ